MVVCVFDACQVACRVVGVGRRVVERIGGCQQPSGGVIGEARCVVGGVGSLRVTARVDLGGEVAVRIVGVRGLLAFRRCHGRLPVVGVIAVAGRVSGRIAAWYVPARIDFADPVADVVVAV